MKINKIDIKAKAQASWRFLIRLADNFKKHELHIRASSIAYYALFSIFPLLLLALFVGTRVLRAEEVRLALHDLILQAVPTDVTNLETIIDQTLAAQTSIGIFSVVGLVWSASSAFNILEMALSVIWGSTPRPFWRRRALGALSVILLCVAFVVSFFLRPILSWALLLFSNFVPIESWFYDILSLVLIYVTTLLFFRIYPNRSVNWPPAMVGALITTLLLSLANSGFSAYLDLAFSNFGYLYGSIAWLLLLGFWAYLVTILFFVGAEVAVLLEEDQIFE